MEVEGENGEPLKTIFVRATVNDVPLLRKMSERFAEAADALDAGTSVVQVGWFRASYDDE
jgi:hypothetical protein